MTQTMLRQQYWNQRAGDLQLTGRKTTSDLLLFDLCGDKMPSRKNVVEREPG